jgi:tellurite resistance protein TerC
VEKFTYLKPSLAFVLVFVGGKMALIDVVKIHAAVSLAVVLSILAIGIVASALRNKRDTVHKPAAALPERVS